MSSKINIALGCKHIQVFATGIIFIKPHAAIALYASVHLVVDEWAEVLIDVCPFFEVESAIRVTCHHGHVLQMTGAAFIAHRAIMRVIGHEPLYDSRSEVNRGLVSNGNPLIVGNGLHA